MGENTAAAVPVFEIVTTSSLVESFHKRGYNLVPSPTATECSTDTRSTSSTDSNDDLARSIVNVLNRREPRHGQSALHIAVRKADLPVVNALLQLRSATSIVNLVDNNGNTALHFAVACGGSKGFYMSQVLLQADASIDRENNCKLTPIATLMLTLKKDDPNILQLLLSYHADPNTFVNGVSLLHLAVEKRFGAVACCLVSHGASITTADEVQSHMVYELTPKALLVQLVIHLKHAPTFVLPDQQNHCTQCNVGPFVDLRRPKHGIMRWFRKIFSRVRVVESRNCFHCGLIFCTSCTKFPLLEDALPPTFTRKPTDLLCDDPYRICRTCDSILRLRQRKSRDSLTFTAKSLGYDP